MMENTAATCVSVKMELCNEFNSFNSSEHFASCLF